MAYQAFYELDAWKRAREFKKLVFEISKSFPAHERFELTSQLRRAVRSIPTNIAEGHGRFTFKDQSHFCVIAKGSLSEVLNHLIDAFDCDYISRDELMAIQKHWDQTGKVISGYLTFLQSRIQNGGGKGMVKEDDSDYIVEASESDNEATFLQHLETGIV